MKVLFTSFGCDKNLVDSENMLGILAKEGYEFTQDEMEADIIIVNTCCFINDAKEESINALIDYAAYKTEGRCKRLIATGCLAQRYHEEIKEELPEVDAIVGTNSYDDIVKAVKEAGLFESVKPLEGFAANEKRVLTTGGHYAYLKIAEGCNKRCSYCIIPTIRGNYRSVPVETLVAEARDLVSQGVRELILVAQETSMYGIDIYKEKSLPRLLKELSSIDELKWIRILYCYPEEINQDLINAIKENPKVCHYLDIPVQHASDSILKAMGRRTDNADLRRIITHLREEIPDIALRTTLITGFPGETEEDHEILMDFVDEMEFDRLGVFTYSPEEGTRAAEFDNQIEEEVKEERQAELMELQQDIAFANAQDMIGRTLEVFIEGKVMDEGVFAGRTYMDAPDVDGLIFVNATRELMSGEIVTVKVTGAQEYDLIGEMLDEFTK